LLNLQDKNKPSPVEKDGGEKEIITGVTRVQSPTPSEGNTPCLKPPQFLGLSKLNTLTLHYD